MATSDPVISNGSNEYWNKRFDQCKSEANALKTSYEPQWDRNFKMYCKGNLWKHDAPEGLKHLTDNRTQNAIISTTAIQTEQRPQLRLTPVETNEEKMIFVKPDAARLIANLIQSGSIAIEGFSEGQLQGAEPIDEDQLGVLLTQVVDDTQDDGKGEGQPILDEEDFVLMDDQYITERLQTVWEQIYDRSDADFYWVQNITNSAIVGHQPMIVQWADNVKLPEHFNVKQKRCWIDPNATGIEDADYFIYEDVVSREEAIARFPDFEEQINRSVAGEEQKIQTQPSAGDDDTVYERKMVAIGFGWWRFEKFTTSEQDEEGNETEYTETHIAQVTRVGDVVVEAIKCPYDDINCVWNINIPIPHRPYGQGEPERLESIQEAINRTLSILHNHLKYFQSPMVVMPRSVKNAMPRGVAMHAHPGKEITLPDDLVEQFGDRLKIFIDPPTLPAGYVDFFRILLDEHDRLSGNVNVLEGVSRSDQSGRAIEMLQTAARGVSGYKATFTIKALVYYARLVLGMIRDFMDVNDWRMYVSDMSPQAVEAFANRVKQMEFDVRIETVAGKGTNRRIQHEEAIRNFQASLMSRQDAMKQLEVPDIEGNLERMARDPVSLALAAAQTNEGT